MTELKPCPFCGGEAKHGYDGDPIFGCFVHWVYCEKCHAKTRESSDEDFVIESWNKRPNPWHTGTPTEDGEYLVICQYVINNYYYREKLVWEFENGNWKNKQRLTENNYIEELKILAWYGQKIEPYKED